MTTPKTDGKKKVGKVTKKNKCEKCGEVTEFQLCYDCFDLFLDWSEANEPRLIAEWITASHEL